MSMLLTLLMIYFGLVVLWAAAGTTLGVRRRQDRLGPIVLAASALEEGKPFWEPEQRVRSCYPLCFKPPRLSLEPWPARGRTAFLQIMSVAEVVSKHLGVVLTAVGLDAEADSGDPEACSRPVRRAAQR